MDTSNNPYEAPNFYDLPKFPAYDLILNFGMISCVLISVISVFILTEIGLPLCFRHILFYVWIISSVVGLVSAVFVIFKSSIGLFKNG